VPSNSHLARPRMRMARQFLICTLVGVAIAAGRRQGKTSVHCVMLTFF
jgi:hypothetical protein